MDVIVDLPSNIEELTAAMMASTKDNWYLILQDINPNCCSSIIRQWIYNNWEWMQDYLDADMFADTGRGFSCSEDVVHFKILGTKCKVLTDPSLNDLLFTKLGEVYSSEII